MNQVPYTKQAYCRASRKGFVQWGENQYVEAIKTIGFKYAHSLATPCGVAVLPSEFSLLRGLAASVYAYFGTMLNPHVLCLIS